MPRCPLCGSIHIVITLRPLRRGYCMGCDLVWGLDSALDSALAAPEAVLGAEPDQSVSVLEQVAGFTSPIDFGRAQLGEAAPHGR
jgi:hypothetical protein